MAAIATASLGRWLAAALPKLSALPVLSIPGKAWYHALSTAASAILALYVAFELELASPGSAATTVLIVSSPLAGLVLSKSIWRFNGTLAGVIISVVLIAWFAQSPDSFILALAVWVALCTFAASLLRYFHSYAAVLAGFTISLVALPAADNPDQIFDLATSRLAVVTIGVLCITAVKGLFALNTGPVRLRPALEQALANTASYAARALDLAPGHPVRRRAIADQLLALDPLILAAASKSATTAFKAPAVRLYASILLNLVTLSSSVHDDLAGLDPAGPIAKAIEPLRQRVRDLLDSLCGNQVFLGAGTADTIEAARRQNAEAVDAIASEIQPDTLDTLAIASRLKDIIEQLNLARDQALAIEGGRASRQTAPVSYHRDLYAAVINGLRAAAATILAGSFWFATAWSSGSQMMAGVIPAVALLGTTDRPDLAIAAFVRGIALSFVAAGICEFFLLTQIDGFPLMALVIAPFIVVACLISLNPKHTGSATGFLIFFMTFLNLRNPMQYDLAAFLNSSLATLLGAASGSLIFMIFWPVVPARVVARLLARLKDDLARLAERPERVDLVVWESTMHDRLARIGTRLAAAPERAAVMEDGMTAIHIGRLLAFIWTTAASLPLGPAQRASIEAARVALCHFETAPDAAIAACRSTAEELLADAGTPGCEGSMRTRRLRCAACFHEIARLMQRHRSFFGRPAAGAAAA